MNKQLKVQKCKTNAFKKVEIPPSFHKGKRNKICLSLIEELSVWKSTTKVTTEEFIQLVERIYNDTK